MAAVDRHRIRHQTERLQHSRSRNDDGRLGNYLDSPTACVPGKSDISHPMVLVFDEPMIADRTREDFSGQHDGRGIEGRFLAALPEPSRGRADQRLSCEAHHGGDKRFPIIANEQRSRRIDCDMPIFLAISRQIAHVIDLERPSSRRCVQGDATSQAGCS
jgi:hypothetical protein